MEQFGSDGVTEYQVVLRLQGTSYSMVSCVFLLPSAEFWMVDLGAYGECQVFLCCTTLALFNAEFLDEM